jgi:hypothetical protein
MTETAIDGFDSRMNPVAEKDRLLWTNRFEWEAEEQVGHHSKKNSGQTDPDKVPLPSALQVFSEFDFLTHTFSTNLFPDRTL